jgi:hypothetical protein
MKTFYLYNNKLNTYVNNYSLSCDINGSTYLNSSSNQNLNLCINNDTALYIDKDKVTNINNNLVFQNNTSTFNNILSWVSPTGTSSTVSNLAQLFTNVNTKAFI